MNRSSGVDQSVTAWLDEGTHTAPDRFVWAAIEAVDHTPQRGALPVAMENLRMRLRTAAPVLGVVATAVMLLLAWQLVGMPSVGAPSPEPASALLSADDLRGIVVTDANAPSESCSASLTQPCRLLPPLTMQRTLTGLEALAASETAPVDTAGFVDAILTDLDDDDDPDNGRYGTFAAAFETVADAERAFDAAVANHESPDGWGLTTEHDRAYLAQIGPSYSPYDRDPGLGDEGVYYIDGRLLYGDPALAIYLWRVDNVILHAVRLCPEEGDCYIAQPVLLRSIAAEMDARAH